MKKELIIIVCLFVFLTLGMHHKEWISYPVEHLSSLSTAGAFGFGSFHPIIFTFLVYLVLWVPRGIIKIIKR